ncbi:hypothetical protein [Rheinheimera baltica]|nr:hypothetical protein [Rheinheimera baltica]MDP5151667.1 hypothetical protein [Rheinheimera baltica]
MTLKFLFCQRLTAAADSVLLTARRFKVHSITEAHTAELAW